MDAITYKARLSQAADGSTKTVSKKQAKQMPLVSGGDRNQHLLLHQMLRGRSPACYTTSILKQDSLKICFVEAANSDALSHTRTAHVRVTEHNKIFQQVRLFYKFTEVDTSADIPFS